MRQRGARSVPIFGSLAQCGIALQTRLEARGLLDELPANMQV
jgi:hypothetical protein